MDTLKNIEGRRSVYPAQFNDKEVSKETIEILLKAANCAPSHKKTYPWRFKVVQGTKKNELGDFLAETYKKVTSEEKFSTFKYNKILDKVHKTSAILIICFQRDQKERVPEWEEIAATAMAVQNIWLAATSLDVYGYWSSPSLIKYIGEFVQLAQGEKCIGLFYLGHTDADFAVRNEPKWDDTISWL